MKVCPGRVHDEIKRASLSKAHWPHGQPQMADLALHLIGRSHRLRDLFVNEIPKPAAQAVHRDFDGALRHPELDAYLRVTEVGCSPVK